MGSPTIAKKLSLSALALLLTLGLPAAWFWYTFAGPGYYAEFNDIKARFAAMPGIELVEAGGNDDVTYEDIWATVRIQGKGEIQFFSLTRDSFEHPDHILVGSVGPYDVVVEGEGLVGVVTMATGEPVRSQFYDGTIDLGPRGIFARFFPHPLRNVRDVIDRYDDLCAVLAGWPVEPDRRHLQDERGTDYYFYLKRTPPDA